MVLPGGGTRPGTTRLADSLALGPHLPGAGYARDAQRDAAALDAARAGQRTDRRPGVGGLYRSFVPSAVDKRGRWLWQPDCGRRAERRAAPRRTPGRPRVRLRGQLLALSTERAADSAVPVNSRAGRRAPVVLDRLGASTAPALICRHRTGAAFLVGDLRQRPRGLAAESSARLAAVEVVVSCCNGHGAGVSDDHGPRGSRSRLPERDRAAGSFAGAVGDLVVGWPASSIDQAGRFSCNTEVCRRHAGRASRGSAWRHTAEERSSWYPGWPVVSRRVHRRGPVRGCDVRQAASVIW